MAAFVHSLAAAAALTWTTVTSDRIPSEQMTHRASVISDGVLSMHNHRTIYVKPSSTDVASGNAAPTPTTFVYITETRSDPSDQASQHTPSMEPIQVRQAPGQVVECGDLKVIHGTRDRTGSWIIPSPNPTTILKRDVGASETTDRMPRITEHPHLMVAQARDLTACDTRFTVPPFFLDETAGRRDVAVSGGAAGAIIPTTADASEENVEFWGVHVV